VRSNHTEFAWSHVLGASGGVNDKAWFTAHPKVDLKTGGMYAFGYSLFWRPFATYYRIDPDGRQTGNAHTAWLKQTSFVEVYSTTKLWVRSHHPWLLYTGELRLSKPPLLLRLLLLLLLLPQTWCRWTWTTRPCCTTSA
jgi:hypothetical protein